MIDRIKAFARKQWNRLLGRDYVDRREIRFKEPISWELFERACRSVDLEPGEVRRNVLTIYEHLNEDPPGAEQMQDFCEIVLEDTAGTDIRELPAGQGAFFFTNVYERFFGYVIGDAVQASSAWRSSFEKLGSTGMNSRGNTRSNAPSPASARPIREN